MELTFRSDVTVKLVQKMGGDETLAAAAKVLEPEVYQEYLRTHEKESVAGLLGYMMKHRHGSPFEHSTLTFFVHAPICVWREWHRHRIGFSYNEESGRYKQLEPVFYIPARDRPLVPKEGFKSARPGFRLPTDEEYERFVHTQKTVFEIAYRAYESLLGSDPKQPSFDRGCARNILGVGIYSSCWVTCNPRSLMSFLSLRTHEPDAKFVSYPLWEIELAARVCERMFADGWPLTWKAFCENGRVAP
jgi:thymidylate synthase (FAD)